MKTYNIDDEFRRLMQKILPDLSPTSIQYSEMRRAFACGAASVFYHMGMVSAVMTEAQGAEELEAVSKQLEGFIKIRIGLDA